jgi:23S rRNA pseudouridine1911/1915/1917 synthase
MARKPERSAAATVALEVRGSARGERLDVWLSDALGASSRAAAAALIEQGLVTVDGQRRPKSFRLRGGEAVVVRREPAAPPRPPAPEPRIAWEGEHFVIVDKPPGLVVHPAPGHRGRTLVELLEQRASGAWSAYPVHRLDRDTSGLMLVAKHEHAQRRLQALIRRRELTREYLALACGRLGARRGTIEAPLGRDRAERTRMAVRGARARHARTHFEVERFLPAATLVRVRLETGRTHQIRAHFAAIGHPLCGDRAYGGGGRLGLARQFLHSARIAFRYPGTGAAVEQRSELPADLAAALRRAEAEPR